MLLIYIIVFIVSGALLFFSSRMLINSATRVAQYLEWREFVVTFFIVSFFSSLPEFFIATSSIIHGVPQLSFGNILGANVVDLTLVVAIAVFVLKGMKVESKVVQTGSAFTAAVAILPLILMLDKNLGRIDGLVLILSFAVFVSWVFSKKERFVKVYGHKRDSVVKQFKNFMKDLGMLLIAVAIILLSAEGIVESASVFAQRLNLPISLIGILILGLGTVLPETIFSIISAKRRQPWMILGNLMGAVVVPVTLVMGLTALIYPTKLVEFTPFAITRIFLFISAIFFLVFIRTGRRITRKEAIFLLSFYVLFVICELLFK